MVYGSPRQKSRMGGTSEFRELHADAVEADITYQFDYFKRAYSHYDVWVEKQKVDSNGTVIESEVVRK